jgi:hypothetical protein
MEQCPDCGRPKAKNVIDIIKGFCPKWYAIRDPDAEYDCKKFSFNNQSTRPVGPDRDSGDGPRT